MKHLFATFLFMLASFAPAYAFDSDSAVEVIVSGGHGSGVYIGNGYVLTAGHVATGRETVTIKRTKTKDWADTWEADVLWIDTVHDFALLKIKAAAVDIATAKVACTKPAVGDNVDIVGWPQDLGKVVSHGYVAGDDDKRGPWKNSYVVIAPITFGNSGGPVFNKDGAVIGLAVGILNGTSLSLMAPVEPICTQLPK